MPRPRRSSTGAKLVVLIPARNEEANLCELIPQLVPQVPVIVFDDESEDETGSVAKALGATVIRPKDALPNGWTGKNRACAELAKAAAETDADWFAFIDADVRVRPDFASALRALTEVWPRKEYVITGFPEIVPGRGPQPLFLAWVGWILLSSNPFGVVTRTRLGHNHFTNGQFHVWPREVYARLQPNATVKGSVLEDVMMGRLLARAKVPVLVANISEVFAVRMYDTWQQTLDGMSKNSYEITGSATGSYFLALLLLVLGWMWLAAPWAYAPLAISGLASAIIVRSKWPGLLLATVTMPIILTIGTYTIVRSVAWRRRGTVTWKGRTYP